MNFLSRKTGPTESGAENETQNIVLREIEITVERTWTSLSASVQGMPNASAPPSLPGEDPVS
jgi:hypothetical protein